MTPKVTVTIPTYNRSALLGDTIRSVLDQSLSNIEVLVSDNASTDETAEVVESIGDERLRFLRNPVNRGHFWNLSRGLHLGSAPYVTVLPDDDRMLPGHLEKKVAVLDEHPDVGLVHSAWSRLVIGPDGEALAEVEIATWGNEDSVTTGRDAVLRLLLTSATIEYATTVFRRSVIDPRERFAEVDKGADDVALALRMARRAERVAYLAQPQVAITLHPTATNVLAGGCERSGEDYVATFQSVGHLRGARERFLDRFGAELPDPEGLRAEVRDRSRHELVAIIAHHLRAGESPPTVARLLAEAARMDPQVLLRRDAARLLARLSVAAGRAAIEPISRPGSGSSRTAGASITRRSRSAVRRLRKWSSGRPPVGFVRFGSLRRVSPIGPDWYSRGKPIDRYYIENYLRAHRDDIRGRVLEFGDRNYTTKIGGDRVSSSEVLSIDDEPEVTHVADLAGDELNIGTFDCVICVQVVQLISDLERAFANLRRLVAPRGVLLLSTHGISQLDPSGLWSEQWRLTPEATRRVLAEAFGVDNVEVDSYGNVLAAVAFLHGLSCSELRTRELDHRDPRYPLVVMARATVPAVPASGPTSSWEQ